MARAPPSCSIRAIMKFSCESCLTRYAIADEKVAGRVLKIRCKQCGSVMVVRDPALAQPEAPSFADEATRTISPDEAMRLAREAASPQVPAAAPDESSWDEQPTRSIPAAEAMRLVAAASGAPPPPPAQPDVEWYAMRNGQQIGPLSLEALREQVFSGALGARNYLWRDGMGDWQRMAAIDDLAWLLDEAAATQAPTPGPAEAIAAPAAEPTPVPAPAAEKTPIQDPVVAAPLDSASLFDEPIGEPERTTAARPEATQPASADAGWSLAQERTPAGADEPTPIVTPRVAPAAAAPQKKSRVLGLVAAGVVLAALVAAAAYFLLPATAGGTVSEAGASTDLEAGALRIGTVQGGPPQYAAGVRKALASRLGGYERCVTDHATAGNDGKTVTVRAVVAPSGAVTAASAVEGGAGDLGACLADRTRDIRFPSFAGEPLELAVPFRIAK